MFKTKKMDFRKSLVLFKCYLTVGKMYSLVWRTICLLGGRFSKNIERTIRIENYFLRKANNAFGIAMKYGCQCDRVMYGM